jgi:hypothetical protein
VPLKSLKGAHGIVRQTTKGHCKYFLFARTMEKWFPDVSERQQLTKELRTLKLLRKGKRPDTCTQQVLIAEFGKKVSCYAVLRNRIRDIEVLTAE